MTYHSSDLEHNQEALQGLTEQLNQIDFGRITEEIRVAGRLAAHTREPLFSSTKVAADLMEAMDKINEVYFGPDGAMADAFESINAANELARQFRDLDLAGDIALASTRLAATSAMTQELSQQVTRSPMLNLGEATRYAYQNSDFYELTQAVDEISEMFNDLAWIDGVVGPGTYDIGTNRPSGEPVSG